jgi:cellulose synthase/poly-beta-1,6-N-acetylglucosamine synthase-like glycosyltransferase
MRVQDIEIPYEKDRGWRYRFWEVFPGAVSWTLILLPVFLSLVNPTLFAVFIIGFLLLWFTKAVGLNVRSLQGFHMLHKQQKLDWQPLLDDLEGGRIMDESVKVPKWHIHNVKRLGERPLCMKPNEVVHAIIIATYNESRDTLEPTIKSVLASKYDMKKVILILAYEERGGAETEKQAKALIKEYAGGFMYAEAIKHPHDIPGEMIGKGGNITFAARKLQKYLQSKKIDPSRVPVTTLDADNRPHPSYLSALTYTYCSTEDPRFVSYQPIPLFLNNIWDAPSPMRVIATGNSFWNVILSMRPHMLRNFSSHAQSMQALIDCDFWSVRTIVEDGHQFWRTYFRYDGRHEVFPIFLPIYQDAVLSSTYRKTLKAQFIQLRRWAWGASDIAYVASKGLRRGSKVPRVDMMFKFARLIESHVSWATASLLLAFGALVPVLVQPKNFVANNLPHIASTIQNIALTGIFLTLFLSLKSLPPKPERYKRHRTIFMILQWVLLPVTTILYNTMAAIYSQTRLMFGKYIGKFDVTEKAVKK